MPILVPIQCKLGRIALGLGVRELAGLADVSPNTLMRFERGEVLKAGTLEALRRTFETAGVLILDADDTAGPGVRLRDREAVDTLNRSGRSMAKG